jgi:PTS system mannose-specific IID component
MITRRSIFKVFMGSFFVQSSWSFESMQGLGFAAAIYPALMEIYPEDDSARNAALKRQLVYYNAHPYMASPILGAVINMEEMVSRGECAPEMSVKFKSTLMAPYGAIGDMFFWGGIRPLASCLGIMAALLWGLWGPVVFLVVYNFFHLWMRWRGLENGYQLGSGVVGYIKGLELPRRSVTAHNITAVVLGAVAAVFAWSFVSLVTGGGSGWRSTAIFIAALGVVIVATLLFNMLLRKGLGVLRLVYLVLLPLVLFGMLAY